MANEQNLRPFHKGRSSEEAAKNGRKGGIASGAARRERKTLKEALLMILDEPARDKKGQYTGGTVQDEIITGLLSRAKNGDPRAFELIRDTIGEKPVQDVHVRAGDYSALDDAFAAMKGDAK